MKDGWIVDFWSAVFGVLSKISVFNFIRVVTRSGAPSYGFVEAYVLVHTLLAFVTLVIATINHSKPVSWLLLILVLYGSLRVFETIIYQINVLLFDEYRAFKAGKEYKVRSFRRLVLLLLHNYLEVLCWFGVFYTFFYRSGDLTIPAQNVEFFTIFRESLLMMISFSPERNEPMTSLGMFVITVHSFVGIFMTVIVLARFLALLPAPESKDAMDNRKE